jgi:hypothetical protein
MRRKPQPEGRATAGKVVRRNGATGELVTAAGQATSADPLPHALARYATDMNARTSA